MPLAAHLALATLLTTATLAAPLVAQAQSAYTMTTLSGSFSSDEALTLDTKNRVLGTLTLKVGWRSNDYWWGLPEADYDNFMGQWAQPLFGSTVSATQLSKVPGFLAAASPSGDQLIADGPGLYDRVTKTFQPLPVEIGYPRDVNNVGTVIAGKDRPTPPGEPVADANNPHAWASALVWTRGQAVVTLPTGGFTGAHANAINSAGVIAGTVYKAPSKANMRAARWVKGALEVLDNEPGKVSLARDISDAGHILITKWTPQITPVPSEVSPGGVYDRIDHVDPIHGVIYQGSFTQIVSTIPGYTTLNARQVNASGTVIGTVFSDPPAPGGAYKTPRAYLWRNGLMQDLTTWVATKGVKLPTGAVLSVVVSINDQGSLVAGFEHPSTKKQTYVRLQAKP